MHGLTRSLQLALTRCKGETGQLSVLVTTSHAIATLGQESILAHQVLNPQTPPLGCWRYLLCL